MWNTDISQAPRGHHITAMRNTKTKDGIIRVPVQEFEPDILWLASSCGKVIRSYWIPANKHHDGYWAGFAQKGGTPPVAWQPFIVPEHPNSQATATEQPQAHGSSPCDRPREGQRPATYGQLVTGGESAATHFILEDVGSGA